MLKHLLSIGIFLLYFYNSSFSQSCPSGFKEVRVENYVNSVYWYSDAENKEKSIGEPDGEFSKLKRSNKGELMMPLSVKKGDTITLTYASYNNSSTTARIYLFRDASNYFILGQGSTSQNYQQGTSTLKLEADRDAEFISVYYLTGEKLMVDAISVEKTGCFPVLNLDTTVSGCKNFNLDLCLDSILSDLTHYGSLFSATINSSSLTTPEKGFAKITITSENNQGSDCCDQGKPDKLTFRYQSNNKIANSQTGKSSVTTYSEPNGQSVYIVANASSSKSDTSNPYFSGSVHVDELFTITKSAGSWSTNMYIHVFNSNKSNVLQLIQFHTSCSVPIVPGDQFGNLVLKATEKSGAVCGDTTSNNCENNLMYCPKTDFTGLDSVAINVCLEDTNSLSYCDSVFLKINTKDGNCSNGNCPIGYVEKKMSDIYGNSVYWSKDASNRTNATGEPDGTFAELSKKGYGEVMIPLSVNVGDTITLFYNSATANTSTEASVYLFPDANTYSLLGKGTTSAGTSDGISTLTLVADRTASYISVYYSNGNANLLVDAIGIVNNSTECNAGNAITGTVWHDINKNEKIDNSEDLESNVTVYLYQDANHNGRIDMNESTPVDSMKTDSDGFYAFTREYNGSKDSYVVNIKLGDLPGGAKLSTDSIQTASFSSSGNRDDYNDFGYWLPAVPVKLISFKGKREGNNVLLNWSTAMELNNARFDIERRLDNEINFEIIDEVMGGGNSSNILRYQYLDQTIGNASLIYYRLKQIDFDGKFEYSPIVTISNDNHRKILVYPNPSSSYATISYPTRKGEIVHLQVIDFIGRDVTDAAEPVNLDGSFKLKTTNLDNGTYLILIKTSTEMLIEKLKIEH